MGREDITSPVSQSSFRGLNTKLSDISARSREATALININLTKETIGVREGNALFSRSQLIESGVAKAVTGIYQSILGSTVYQVVTGGTKIYSMNSGGTLTDITGAVVISDSQNNIFSFAKAKDSGGANDIIVACNGVNPPIKWTGAGNAAVLGGSPPANFKHILWRKNRLYGTDGEFIYHSALLDAELWDALNWVLKISSSGFYTNDVTGLVEYGDNIAFFKEDKVVMFSGENFTDGYVQEFAGEGCISGFTPRLVNSRRYGNIIIFLNRSMQLKGFNGTKNFIHISDPIDNLLRYYSQNRAQYASSVNYEKLNQYLVTVSTGGTKHDRVIAYDYFLDGFQQGEDPESTMLIHDNLNANYLSVLNYQESETLFSGSPDGWVKRHDETYEEDVLIASEIASAPTGAVRSANVVTITTLVDEHEFQVDDEVVISGVDDNSFDGTFTIVSVPNPNEFTYAQVEADATSGGGIARKEAKIVAYWQSKKNSYGNAALQKQINDFNIVTANDNAGQIKTTIITDGGVGEATNDIEAQGYFYGDDVYYGDDTEYGSKGTSYNQSKFTMTDGGPALIGRYFTIRFENVDGFIFSLEEFIVGLTSLGYQKEYKA